MKIAQIDTEKGKNPKNFPTFKDFMHFFPIFRQPFWIGTLKRVNKEKMCYPVSFSKSLLQFLGKNVPNWRPKWQNQNFPIFKHLMHFC